MKLVQKIGFNFIFINPGFTTDIFSINGSLFFNLSIIISAKSIGDFLFIFDKTIPTFDEISQLNFSGGISVFIPSNESGNLTKPSFDKSIRDFFILSKYISKMFI